METSPYSAVGNIPVYNRTNKKLNIRGKTVASPYMAVCLKRFLYNPKSVSVSFYDTKITISLVKFWFYCSIKRETLKRLTKSKNKALFIAFKRIDYSNNA